MENIKEVLKEIGLTEKEALVYTTLLSCGNASAYTIAEKSGLKPPTVYLTLQNLITKNLAYTSPRSKKKQFFAKNPHELVADFEEKLSRTKKALPNMLALLPTEISKIKVLYYQGKKGVRESLEYGKKQGYPEKQIIGFYATAENLGKDYIDYTFDYLNDLKKHGVSIRGITPFHRSTEGLLKLKSTQSLNVHTVPYEEYSARASIETNGSIVRIVMLHDEKAIIIEDKELSKMVRQIFEMVWKSKNK